MKIVRSQLTRLALAVAPVAVLAMAFAGRGFP